MAEQEFDVRTLDINQADLDRELCEQSAKYLFVAEQAVRAEINYEAYKAQFAQLEAQLDAKYRADYAAAQERATEKIIENCIRRDPNYQQAQLTLIQMRGKREAAKALKESWFMRQYMLMHLAKKAISELDSILNSAVKAA